MKKILSLLFLLITLTSFATVKIKENDGSPTGTADIIQVANGTLTLSGNTATLASEVPSTRTITIAGTSNEINSSAGAQDLSANRTWTLSLSDTVDLGGKSSFEIPNGASPTVDAFGEIAGDNNLWGANRGAPVFYDGTASVGLIGALVSDTPSAGQVPKFNSGGTITWEDDDAGVGGTGVAIIQEGDITTTTGADTLDFGSGFDLTESPAGEVNISFDSTEVTTILQKPPDWGCDNCSIVTSISSNDLVVALKGRDGNDCSATNVCTVTIGATTRQVTAALSATLADGTAWFGLSPESTAQDIDFFTYLVWDSNSSAVDITFARISTGRLVSDFSSITTNSKYLANYANYTSTDELTLIGRFNATLGVTATFLWTLPATSIIVQHPVYETRWMAWTPTVASSAGTAPTYTDTYVNRYRIVGANCQVNGAWNNTAGGTAGSGPNAITVTFPFPVNSVLGSSNVCLGMFASWESAGTQGGSVVLKSSTNFVFYREISAVSVIANDQSSTARQIFFNLEYEI